MDVYIQSNWMSNTVLDIFKTERQVAKVGLLKHHVKEDPNDDLVVEHDC